MIQVRVSFNPDPPYGTYVVRFWDRESIQAHARWKRRRDDAAAAATSFEEASPAVFDKRVMVPANYWRELGLEVPRSESDRALHLAIAWATQQRNDLAIRATSTPRPAPGAPLPPSVRAAATRGGEFDLATTVEWYIDRNPNDGTALTLLKYRDHAQRLIAFFGASRLLSTITRVDAELYRNTLRERDVRNRTIKGDLTFLKQIAYDSYEHRQTTLMAVLQLLKLPRVKKQKSLKRPLTIEELRRIVGVRLERDGDRVIGIIIRAFTTGLRKWPLLNLEESWTDRVAGLQRIPGWAMKGGEDRWEDDDFEVPICQWAIDVTPRPRTGSKWNFANRDGRPNKQLDRSLYEIARKAEGCDAATIEACAEANHEHRWFCLQELRMTFLTLLDAAGVEEPVREILVGHRPKSVSEESYIRRDVETLRKAVACMDDLRAEIEGKAGTVVRLSSRRRARR